jgi:hypothetical protein
MVDRMGELLELGWCGRIAVRDRRTDSTAALLVAASAYSIFGGGVDHPIHGALGKHGMSLVDETPFSADLGGL